MTRISFLTSATAFALAAGIGTASAAPAGPYVTGEGGVSLMPDQNLSHTPAGTLKEDLNAGYNFGGAIGYDFGDGTRIELNSLTARADLNSLGGKHAGGHVDATGLMLNGKYDLMHNSATTPYIGAGIGFQNVGAKVAGMQGQNWEPAYQLEAGLRHTISNNVSVFGEYRWTQSEASKISGGGATAYQNFSNNALIAGVTYHLGG